jgi:hypothetical protein
MRHSSRASEGYLFLDHSQSPGLPDDMAVAAGLPPGAGRGLFESATIVCNHCPQMIVLNPNRTRERHYCSNCGRYICDVCAEIRKNSGLCMPYERIIDEFCEKVVKQESLIQLAL